MVTKGEDNVKERREGEAISDRCEKRELHHGRTTKEKRGNIPQGGADKKHSRL